MSAGIVIEPVTDARGILTFVKFPFKLYRGDPNWVPPFIEERRDFFDPKKNPFYQHARYQLFLARRGGELVGTIGAVINDNHNAFHNEQVGAFGFFECINDQAVADALFEAAEDWVRGQGMKAIRGPLNFSTNDECGTLIEGFHEPPMVMMTYNPRYYVDFIEGAGFHKAMDLLAYMVDLTAFGPHGEYLPPKLLRVAQKVQERGGFTVRTMDMRHFEREVELFKRIYNSAWEKNWGFVPLTDAEIDHMAVGLRQLLDPDIVVFAEKDGEPVGAMLPLPDVSQALIKAYPRPDRPEWWTMLRLLWYWRVRRCVDTMRGFAGGVLEPYRGRGVEALLFIEMAKAALPRYRRCEISWVLETNMMMRRTAEMLQGRVYRTYRLYEKTL